jgi:hypothetical protein
LDDFFEMAEYDWLPKPVGRTDQGGRSSPALGRSSPMPFSPTSAGSTREPSTYLFEMITFLTAYVDSVLIMLSETTKTQTYRNALEHVRAGLMVSMLVDEGVAALELIPETGAVLPGGTGSTKV